VRKVDEQNCIRIFGRIIYMMKAVLGGPATQLIDLARSISSADGSEVGSKDGGELLLFDSGWLCLKAFHLIAENRSCSLKARDVRAW
jgi:hypothetical protein